MSNKVHIVLVLDRSGSMQSVVPATIKGVNELISTLKSVQRETKQEITASFIGFESDYGLCTAHEFMTGYEDVALNDIQPVTTKEIYGRGGTEMNKAILFGIKSLSHKEEPVLFCIFTDGETSDTGLFSEAARAVVEKQSKGWTFAFVGANQKVSDVAETLNIPVSNVMEYKSDMLGTRSAFYKLSRGVRKYLETQAKPQTENGLARFDNFFNDEDMQKSKMNVNGFSVTINMPESVKSKDDADDNALPPYAPVVAHVVDEYPASPSNWMHGSSKASSYFVGVKPEHGMWLDFNDNSKNERDVAIVVSVQGINPITGQKTSELRLEKYEKSCPVHNEEFAQERFCKSCGFKWPAQNYLSSTGTPKGEFWMDGFRSPDGKVRQYIFTEEQARGIANSVIGDDRVFAIGIAFFRSKSPKPKPVPESMKFSSAMFHGLSAPAAAMPIRCNLRSSNNYEVATCSSVSPNYTSEALSIPPAGYTEALVGSSAVMPDLVNAVIDRTSYQLCPPIAPKSYEVAAGAKLDQKLHDDPNELNYWEEEPYGFVYINYADAESVEKILVAGKRKEAKEGFLSNAPVGNR